MTPLDYLWVSLAGSLGAVGRFFVDGVVKERWGDRLGGRVPIGTMAINVSGSLLLGFLVGLVAFDGRSELWKIVAGTGFCGGFTTFSTASFETVRLIQARAYRVAALSCGGTVVAGVGAAAVGMALSRV